VRRGSPGSACAASAFRGGAAGGATALSAGALLLVAAVWLLLSAPPAAAAYGETTQFTITGRGWGHGIGMSQWGAYGYARNGWKHRAILRHYYKGVSFGKRDNRYVRVLLASGQANARVASSRAFKAGDGSRTVTIPAGATATVTWTGSAYRVAAGGKSWTFSKPVTFRPGTQPLRMINTNLNGFTRSGGARYRGTLRVVRSGSSFLIVNRLRLEPYLRGVVPNEVPSSWPVETLRAQAVCARSYALRVINARAEYDLVCTPASQVYNGYERETARTNAAVSATAGVVPISGGRPIVAYYSSTSGGHTENIENVWGGSPVAYLKGVKDPYDSYSPHHIWKDAPYRWNQDVISRKLGAYSSSNTAGVRGTPRAIYVTRRGTSPRVVRAYVLGSQSGSEHAASLASGWTLRNKLGLRDSWFTVRSMSMSPRQADSVVITYGERVKLEGRTYPALPTDKRTTLRYQRDGKWRSTGVAAGNHSRHTFTMSAGGTSANGAYTAYTFSAGPGRKTTYSFAYGEARSPQTVIQVRPALELAADAPAVLVGEQVSFTGAVRPRARRGLR
jgi:stage II sporulation protein D